MWHQKRIQPTTTDESNERMHTVLPVASISYLAKLWGTTADEKNRSNSTTVAVPVAYRTLTGMYLHLE